MKRVNFERNFWNEKAKLKDVDREMHDPEISLDEELKIILGKMPVYTFNILEIGCGIGRLIIPLAKYRSDLTFYGVDISESLLTIANKRAVEDKAKNIEFTDNNGRKLPYPDKMFDFIYSITVFQHIDQEGVASYLKEAGKKLDINGILLFQFIEGDEHEPMSHHYRWEYLSWKLSQYGFLIQSTEVGLIYPNWTWVTAKKMSKNFVMDNKREMTGYEPMSNWS